MLRTHKPQCFAWFFSLTRTITHVPPQGETPHVPNNPNQNANSQDQKLSCWTKSTALVHKKIFPNDKCEPTDHRRWKMEWYTLNNDYLELWLALLPWAVQNQAVESALLQTKRIYLSIRCDNFFFRMKSSQPACSQAHAPPRHFESVPNAPTADHYFKKKGKKGTERSSCMIHFVKSVLLIESEFVLWWHTQAHKQFGHY